MTGSFQRLPGLSRLPRAGDEAKLGFKAGKGEEQTLKEIPEI